MSVVLRCPNCGTTRATPGECEACQEGPVRYFCTNHAPGIWLSERTCSKCGSSFGEPARATSAERARPAHPPARAAVAVRVREPMPESPVVSSSRPAPRPRYPRAERPAVGEALEPSELRIPPWQKALSAALRARSAAIAARDPERLPLALGTFGCLRRLLLTAVVLLLAIGTAVFLFGRALFQAFQP
jgi:hypothetical protein